MIGKKIVLHNYTTSKSQIYQSKIKEIRLHHNLKSNKI